MMGPVSYRWMAMMGRMYANTPYLRVPSRDHISYSLSFEVLNERENSVIAQGVVKRPPPSTVGGRDLKEWGLEFPLILLKQLSLEETPSRECETADWDLLSLFCLSDHGLMLFVGIWEVEREVRVVETLVDEVGDPSRLVYSNQGSENLPSCR